MGSKVLKVVLLAWTWCLLAGFALVLASPADEADPEEGIQEEIVANQGFYPLLMPNVHPPSDESYLCTPIKLNPDQTYYITGFRPNATAATAHHMLIYGCDSKPGSSKAVWPNATAATAHHMNCGEMSRSFGSGMDVAKPCSGSSRVVYAWAMDAPALVLPPEVGFKVGAGSDINYLVLQVHYATIAPFKGQVVSGYRVRKTEDSGYDWQLIGKQDPQLPQMFYPAQNELQIRQGDIIASRCTMKSNRMRITTVGPTNRHEMCNFYMMYWVDGGNPLEQKYCQTAGPPLFYWSWYGLRNIPQDASVLDDLVLASTDYEADPEDIEEEIAPNHGFIPFLMPNIRPSVYISGQMRQLQRKCGMVCSGRSRVMYGWAKDAPELFLPPEVGFNVGRGSGLKYLVLQVHYSNVAPFKGGKRDNSGVFLHYTTEPQPKSAGVFMLSTGGVIKPHSTAHMESACQIKEDKVIHPFAFRTHTHTLGFEMHNEERTEDNHNRGINKLARNVQFLHDVLGRWRKSLEAGALHISWSSIVFLVMVWTEKHPKRRLTA
ncbi:unnamed protein product [Notodromas monacha]|uniref:Peptidylglycine monooxygenase n=1 Tax=Notodromas monacha TaxID=399045 RepID=A0A7R9GF34_9CRUS|nr:unnamed protein product [Notodromas monacha]CAG0920277.1 unnamed protein product [Notodromas monacha]